MDHHILRLTSSCIAYPYYEQDKWTESVSGVELVKRWLVSELVRGLLLFSRSGLLLLEVGN
jgi:hypothetical protein